MTILTFLLGIYTAGTLFFLWWYLSADEPATLGEHLLKIGSILLWPIGIVVAIGEAVIQSFKK